MALQDTENPSAPVPRPCPRCGTTMYFSADGQALCCDRCGYLQPVTRPAKQNRIEELERTIRWAQDLPGETDRSRGQPPSWGVWLTQGQVAAREKQVDEAFFYLSRVLLSPSRDPDRLEAWLALSVVCQDPAEQRRCFENALAIDPYEPRARKGLAMVEGRLHADELINPDAVPTGTSEEPLPAVARRMTCPHCGGPTSYAADQKMLTCAFCGYRQVISPPSLAGQAGDSVAEQDFIAAMFTARGHRRPEQARTLRCRGCGAHFLLGPETLSMTCAYCGAVYVALVAETEQLLPPDAVIPHAGTQAQAQDKVRLWFHRHHLEPQGCSDLVGLYYPVWTFDVHAALLWHAPSMNQAGTRVGTEALVDQACLYVDDFRVPAGSQLPPTLHRCLQGFDLAGLVPFDPRFLADWPAERHQISLADASLRARAAVSRTLWRTNRAKVRRLRPSRPSARVMIGSFKSVLLPLWLGHYQLQDRRYRLVVTGQTLVAEGERPGPQLSDPLP